MNGASALTLWRYCRYSSPKLCTIKRSSAPGLQPKGKPANQNAGKTTYPASLERRADHPQQDAAVDGVADEKRVPFAACLSVFFCGAGHFLDQVGFGKLFYGLSCEGHGQCPDHKV